MDKITLRDFLKLAGADYNKDALFYVTSSEIGSYVDYCSFSEKERTIGDYYISRISKETLHTSRDKEWKEVLALYLYDKVEVDVVSSPL